MPLATPLRGFNHAPAPPACRPPCPPCGSPQKASCASQCTSRQRRLNSVQMSSLVHTQGCPEPEGGTSWLGLCWGGQRVAFVVAAVGGRRGLGGSEVEPVDRSWCVAANARDGGGGRVCACVCKRDSESMGELAGCAFSWNIPQGVTPLPPPPACILPHPGFSKEES